MVKDGRVIEVYDHYPIKGPFCGWVDDLGSVKGSENGVCHNFVLIIVKASILWLSGKLWLLDADQFMQQMSNLSEKCQITIQENTIMLI